MKSQTVKKKDPLPEQADSWKRDVWMGSIRGSGPLAQRGVFLRWNRNRNIEEGMACANV